MPLHEEQIELSGPILGGRDSQTKDSLLVKLKAMPANSMLVLDLGDVQFMDYSWADEVVANLLKASQRAKTPKFVLVRRPSHSVSESIAAAVSLHGLTCVQVDEQGNASVLGNLSPALLLTYNLAATLARSAPKTCPTPSPPAPRATG